MGDSGAKRFLVAESVGYEAPASEDEQKLFWEGKPFFAVAPAPIDERLFLDALEEVAAYLLANGGLGFKEATALEAFDWSRMLGAVDVGLGGSQPALFVQECVTWANEDAHSKLSDTLLVTCIGYALRSMLEPHAQTAMDEIANELKDSMVATARPLHCPVCGGNATAARVGATPAHKAGGRMLYCATCGTRWEFERIRCANCGTHNSGHLHYFHVEGDTAHRLYSCQECGSYTRTTFDEDLDGEPSVFEVEDVVMARLDAIAHDPRFRENGQDVPSVN